MLASVTYAAGIIDERMFTALVLASILTSLAAGLWLRWRLARDPEAFIESARLPAALEPGGRQGRGHAQH